MYPVLLRIPVFGGFTINSYGVMVALGFVLGIVWVHYESRRLGQDPAKALDLVFYILIAAIIGSRVFHIAVSERSAFLANPIVFFKVWRGGLVFYGGLLSSIAVAWWYTRRHRMPFLLTCDIFAPAISIGHALGRVGCFLAGCCYGRTVDGHPWYGITFPSNPESFAPGSVALYPTQLMEVSGEVIIFLILLIVRRFRRFDGQLMATYLMLYAVLRYVNEIFRGDIQRGFLIDPWMSTSQFISLLVFAVGAFMYFKLWPREKTAQR